MDPQQWQRIDQILAQVQDLPKAQQGVFLETHCQNTEVRREVEALLSHDATRAFFDCPLFQQSDDGIDDAQRIGPYEIVRLLGRGGMGSVFLATRQDDFSQQVAIKLIKRGMDSDEIIQRFQKERQILADLEHPNIASLHDGGTTEDGRLYFVMEYIDGEPIDRFCNHRKLAIKDRLELFCQVCSAVHLSHQKLILHRDIKPGNILIDQSSGLAKLLDFGIAKVLQPNLGMDAATTLPGYRPLTLRYSSPEQLRGGAVTTASDTYSLGVVLYLLLTGQLPDDLRPQEEASSVEESIQRLLDFEPIRPSQIVSQSSEGAPSVSTGESRQRHSRQLRGDLDAIVLKALRKEANHRYGSAFELMTDIRRHLSGLPVTARKGSWSYLMGKNLRRHRVALAFAAVLAVATLTSTMLWQQAVSEKQRALAGESRATGYLTLLKQFLKSFDPNRLDNSVPLDPNEILDESDPVFAMTVREEPRLQADLMGVQAVVYRSLGHFGIARKLMEDSLLLFQQEAPPQGDSELAEAHSNLAALCFDINDEDCSAIHSQRALDIRIALGQKDTVEIVKTLNNLASIRLQQGDFEKAEELYRRGLEIRLRQYGPEHHNVATSNVATSQRNLANLYFLQGKHSEAEELLVQALETRRRVFSDRHLQVVSVLRKLAEVRHALGQRHDAESLFLETLDIQTEHLAQDHPQVALTRLFYASFLLDQESLSLAEQDTISILLQSASSVLAKSGGEVDWKAALAESLLGSHLLVQGHREDAGPCLLDGFQGLQAARGSEAIYTRQAGRRLAGL